MKKYVVKNCPARDFGYRTCYGSTSECQNITNCLLKQIIKKCKEYEYCKYGAIQIRNPLVDEIYELLNIQEVD